MNKVDEGIFHVDLSIEFNMGNKYCEGINMTATLSQTNKNSSLFYKFTRNIDTRSKSCILWHSQLNERKFELSTVKA